jgi:hypothetical protein
MSTLETTAAWWTSAMLRAFHLSSTLLDSCSLGYLIASPCKCIEWLLMMHLHCWLRACLLTSVGMRVAACDRQLGGYSLQSMQEVGYQACLIRDE